MLRPYLYLFLAAFSVLVATPLPADLLHEGPEFQLHTTTIHDQLDPNVAANGGGGFVAGWAHVRQDSGENRDIFLRRFDANALPLTGELPGTVVADRTGTGLSHLESDASGDFVIGVQDQLLCCNFYSRSFYKLFHSDGTEKGPLRGVAGAPFANTGLTGLAVAPDGSFLLGYGLDYEGSDPRNGGFQALVDPAGVEGPAIRLTPDPSYPYLAASPLGGFLQTLRGEAQWLAADGTATGPATPLDLQTTGLVAPVPFVQPSGVGLVVWSRWDTDADTSEIFARRIATDGTLLGPVRTLSEAPIAWFLRFDVAVMPNGSFVVVWDQAEFAGGPKNIFARHFSSEALPLSATTRVNPPDFGDEREPKIATLDHDTVVVVWENLDGQDGDGGGVYGQRLLVPPTPIFIDGFESGDLSAWSAASQ